MAYLPQPTATVAAPSERSKRSTKLTVLRRYGDSPGAPAVVSWLARFSAITRSRVVCAAMPPAEMPSAVSMSMPGYSLLLSDRARF